MSEPSLVLLAVEGESTRIVFNSLRQQGFNIARVILEEKISTRQLLRRRIQTLGLLTVSGQILFRALIVTLLNRTSQRRLTEIKKEFGLDVTPIPETFVTHVSSVNSEATLEALQALQPAAVVINGTRIISGKVLKSLPAKFLNTHVGITPLYRGVHGAYWALVNGQPQHCGVTVHLVDTGIDTGGILGQALIVPTASDNFVTYPLLQLAAGLPILQESLRTVLANEIQLQPSPLGLSKLWSHPTLWAYGWHRLRHGIK
jgi:folate-dependent phosphoribosylglycinamide formyltransferase PurN